MAKKRMKIPSRPVGRGGGKKNSQKDLMKQFSQMQEQLLEAQNKFNEEEFTGSAGGGAVNVVVLGSLEVKSLSIDPEVIDEDDVEMLEDLIIAAISDAQRKVNEASSSQTDALTGGLPSGLDLSGLNIPGF